MSMEREYVVVVKKGVDLDGIPTYPQKVVLEISGDKEGTTIKSVNFTQNSIYRKSVDGEPWKSFINHRIPFRIPKNNKKAVLNAITKFYDKYISELYTYKDVLLDSELVDYEKILK